MFVLGLILLLLAVALFVVFLLFGNQTVAFDNGLIKVTLDSLTIYLLGALTLLLLVAGLALVRGGARMAAKRRKERKELSKLKKEKAERTTEPVTTGDASTTTGAHAATTTDTRADTGTDTATESTPPRHGA